MCRRSNPIPYGTSFLSSVGFMLASVLLGAGCCVAHFAFELHWKEPNRRCCVPSELDGVLQIQLKYDSLSDAK